MFFDLNPILPLENLCSHLETYQPQNDSQAVMLNYANKLILLEDNFKGAGLFIWGEAGIGKSHIAVGIAKKFMLKGLTHIFQFADRFNFQTILDLKPTQVWVIDDLNNGYGLISQLFKKVVLNAHELGGRVFITSKKNYDELLKEMIVGDGNANRIRYDDRTNGMFKILNVTGNSYRQTNA